jgi:hypothetical protein
VRTLYIRHVPDAVAERLETLARQAGVPLSTFALKKLTEASRPADNAELLEALPSHSLDREVLLEALWASRQER